MVLIQMKMPKSCGKCPFLDMDYSDFVAYCRANDNAVIEDGCGIDDEKRSSFCPLKMIEK